MRPVTGMSAPWCPERLWQRDRVPGFLARQDRPLHLIAQHGHQKRLADIALVLDSADIPIVSYAVKKLEAAGLIRTRRTGKEKMVAISQAGFDVCQSYGRFVAHAFGNLQAGDPGSGQFLR